MSSREQRFDDLYRDYFGLVHAYCHRRTPADRAKDSTAETFLSAWRRIDEVPPGPDALPWLYGVARGVVSNTRRSSFRASRLSRKLLAIGPPRKDLPDDVIVLRHEATQILRALDELSPADQEVLRLSIWEELPGSQLAIALDVSEQAARQRLSRARARLAASYNDLEVRGHVHAPLSEGGAR